MARPFDPAALRRLNAPLRAGRGLMQPSSARMGYEPGLDGLRAIALLLVGVHHLRLLGSGPDWFDGGFVGIEIFFVTSSYLVTVRLLEEWERDGRIAVGEFIGHRIRRQLPLVTVLLVAIAAAAALWRPETLPQLRSDVIPALFSLSNWREVWDHVGHFAARDNQPLLHHLWPVAVEMQWFLLWPIALVAMLRWARGGVRQVRLVLAAAAVLAALAGPATYRAFDTFRIDLAYLATFSRAAGLLLGAVLATLWTPWRWHGAGRRRLPLLDGAGVLAIAATVGLASRLRGTGSATYRYPVFILSGPRVLPGGLCAAALLAVIVVAGAVHPGATFMHRALGWRPLAEVGRRAFQLYLWHWPILVLVRAEASAVRLALGLLLTVAVTEVAYRFVQLPLRGGSIARWIGEWRAAAGTLRRDYTVSTLLYGVAAICLVGAVVARLAHVDATNLAVDRSITEFDATAVLRPVVPPANTVASAPSTTAPVLPRNLLVLGDSQAHSLVVNRPSGIEGTFDLTDGSRPDCGVFDRGSLITSRKGFRHEYGQCAGWVRAWSEAARSAQPDVSLVVLGAWEVFDIKDGDTTLAFGSPEFDQRFLAKLDLGIEALKSAGSKIALLEIPCFRPIDVAEADVVALTERGDDARVTHLNGLLRQAAADDPAFVTFVPGASQWCTDPVIAADRAYRWNGVDFYKAGAKLQYEALAAAVVRIPV